MKELVESLQLALGPICQEFDRPDGSRLLLARRDYALQNLHKPPRPSAKLVSLAAVPEWIVACWRWMPADAAESWLFFDGDGLVIVPDTRSHPCMGRSTYEFAPTMAAKLWAVGEAEIKQQTLKRMIEAAVAMGEEQIILHDTAKWLAAVTKMKQVAKVTKESFIESNTDFKVAFESKSGPETATVPKELVVELTPFEGAADKVRLCYQVEPQWADGEPPRFSLICYGFVALLDQARRAAVAWIEAQVAELAAAAGHERRLVVFNGKLDTF